MNNESEIVMLVLCIPVIFFVYYFRRDIKNLAAYKQLLLSFLFFFLACIFTNIEQFFWFSIFNFMEHLFYVGSSLFMIIWAHKYFVSERGNVKYD